MLFVHGGCHLGLPQRKAFLDSLIGWGSGNFTIKWSCDAYTFIITVYFAIFPTMNIHNTYNLL